MTLKELQLAVWEPSDNLRVDLMDLWMAPSEDVLANDEAHQLLGECIDQLTIINNKIQKGSKL